MKRSAENAINSIPWTIFSMHYILVALLGLIALSMSYWQILDH